MRVVWVVWCDLLLNITNPINTSLLYERFGNLRNSYEIFHNVVMPLLDVPPGTTTPTTSKVTRNVPWFTWFQLHKRNVHYLRAHCTKETCIKFTIISLVINLHGWYKEICIQNFKIIILFWNFILVVLIKKTYCCNRQWIYQYD